MRILKDTVICGDEPETDGSNISAGEEIRSRPHGAGSFQSHRRSSSFSVVDAVPTFSCVAPSASLCGSIGDGSPSKAPPGLVLALPSSLPIRFTREEYAALQTSETHMMMGSGKESVRMRASTTREGNVVVEEEEEKAEDLLGQGQPQSCRCSFSYDETALLFDLVATIGAANMVAVYDRFVGTLEAEASHAGIAMTDRGGGAAVPPPPPPSFAATVHHYYAFSRALLQHRRHQLAATLHTHCASTGDKEENFGKKEKDPQRRNDNGATIEACPPQPPAPPAAAALSPGSSSAAAAAGDVVSFLLACFAQHPLLTLRPQLFSNDSGFDERISDNNNDEIDGCDHFKDDTSSSSLSFAPFYASLRTAESYRATRQAMASVGICSIRGGEKGRAEKEEDVEGFNNVNVPPTGAGDTSNNSVLRAKARRIYDHYHHVLLGCGGVLSPHFHHHHHQPPDEGSQLLEMLVGVDQGSGSDLSGTALSSASLPHLPSSQAPVSSSSLPMSVALPGALLHRVDGGGDPSVASVLDMAEALATVNLDTMMDGLLPQAVVEGRSDPPQAGAGGASSASSSSAAPSAGTAVTFRNSEYSPYRPYAPDPATTEWLLMTLKSGGALPYHHLLSGGAGGAAPHNTGNNNTNNFIAGADSAAMTPAEAEAGGGGHTAVKTKLQRRGANKAAGSKRPREEIGEKEGVAKKDSAVGGVENAPNSYLSSQEVVVEAATADLNSDNPLEPYFAAMPFLRFVKAHTIQAAEYKEGGEEEGEAGLREKEVRLDPVPPNTAYLEVEDKLEQSFLEDPLALTCACTTCRALVMVIRRRLLRSVLLRRALARRNATLAAIQRFCRDDIGAVLRHCLREVDEEKNEEEGDEKAVLGKDGGAVDDDDCIRIFPDCEDYDHTTTADTRRTVDAGGVNAGSGGRSGGFAVSRRAVEDAIVWLDDAIASEWPTHQVHSR